MILTAVATKPELEALLESLWPMRVAIDARRGRAVTFGRPELELVPGRGLRLRGGARVAWDLAGLAIPVTIQRWQLLLVPRVASRARSQVLAFEPIVEELELRLVPGFVDDRIAEAIREAVARHRERLAWDFTRTLSKRLPLSRRIVPARVFDLRVVEGSVAVIEDELRASVRLEADFVKAEDPRPDDASRGAPPAAPPPP